jgi:hypothetical protein
MPKKTLIPTQLWEVILDRALRSVQFRNPRTRPDSFRKSSNLWNLKGFFFIVLSILRSSASSTRSSSSRYSSMSRITAAGFSRRLTISLFFFAFSYVTPSRSAWAFRMKSLICESDRAYFLRFFLLLDERELVERLRLRVPLSESALSASSNASSPSASLSVISDNHVRTFPKCSCSS